MRAALIEAKAGLEPARAQEEQAKRNLAIDGKYLDDSLIVSPITGKVSQRLLKPGEMAEKKGTAVNKISEAIRERGAFPPGYDYRFTGDYERMAEAQ